MIVSFGWFYETHVGHSLQGLIKFTDSSVQSYIFEKLRSQTTSEGHAAWCQQTWTFPLQSFVCAYIWSSLSRFQDPDSRTVLWVQWATRCTPPILPFRHRWLSYTWKRVGLREGWGGERAGLDENIYLACMNDLGCTRFHRFELHPKDAEITRTSSLSLICLLSKLQGCDIVVGDVNPIKIMSITGVCKLLYSMFIPRPNPRW